MKGREGGEEEGREGLTLQDKTHLFKSTNQKPQRHCWLKKLKLP